MEYMNSGQTDSGTASGMNQGNLNVPINAWYTNNDLVVEAPLPGIKAENIEIEVRDNNLVVRGNVTGSHGEGKEYINQEWHLGPYERSYRLPCGVDASTANASFGSGVLVVTLPRSEAIRPGKVRLERVGGAQGFAQGHAGQSPDQSAATQVPQFDQR